MRSSRAWIRVSSMRTPPGPAWMPMCCCSVGTHWVNDRGAGVVLEAGLDGADALAAALEVDRRASPGCSSQLAAMRSGRSASTSPAAGGRARRRRGRRDADRSGKRPVPLFDSKRMAPWPSPVWIDRAAWRGSRSTRAVASAVRSPETTLPVMARSISSASLWEKVNWLGAVVGRPVGDVDQVGHRLKRRSMSAFCSGPRRCRRRSSAGRSRPASRARPRSRRPGVEPEEAAAGRVDAGLQRVEEVLDAAERP